MAEYSIFIRPDMLQRFWQVMAGGGFITDAVAVIATSRRTGRRVLAEAGSADPDRGQATSRRAAPLPDRWPNVAVTAIRTPKIPAAG